MELSVVTSVYKNKETLENFLINLSEEISTIGIKDYEIIFINDFISSLIFHIKFINQKYLLIISISFDHFRFFYSSS